MAVLPLIVAHPYPLAPPIPWNLDLETFPFRLFMFIIHSHF